MTLSASTRNQRSRRPGRAGDQRAAQPLGARVDGVADIGSCALHATRQMGKSLIDEWTLDSFERIRDAQQ